MAFESPISSRMRLPGTVRPRQGTPADNDASKMRTVCDSAPWPALHPAGPGALVGTSVRRAASASASHGPRWTAATWAASGPALLYPPGSREAPQGPRVRLCQAASNADSTQGRFSTPYKVLGVNASRYMDGSSCRVCARPPPRGEVRACVVSSVAPRETGDSKAPTRGRGPRPHRGPDGPRDGRLQSAHARCRYGRPFSRPLPGLVRLANPTTPYLTPACCQGHPPSPRPAMLVRPDSATRFPPARMRGHRRAHAISHPLHGSIAVADSEVRETWWRWGGACSKRHSQGRRSGMFHHIPRAECPRCLPVVTHALQDAMGAR